MTIYCIQPKLAPKPGIFVKFDESNLGDNNTITSGLKKGFESFTRQLDPKETHKGVFFQVNRDGDILCIKARRTGLSGIVKSDVFKENGVNKFNLEELEDRSFNKFLPAIVKSAVLKRNDVEMQSLEHGSFNTFFLGFSRAFTDLLSAEGINKKFSIIKTISKKFDINRSLNCH